MVKSNEILTVIICLTTISAWAFKDSNNDRLPQIKKIDLTEMQAFRLGAIQYAQQLDQRACQTTFRITKKYLDQKTKQTFELRIQELGQAEKSKNVIKDSYYEVFKDLTNHLVKNKRIRGQDTQEACDIWCEYDRIHYIGQFLEENRALPDKALLRYKLMFENSQLEIEKLLSPHEKQGTKKVLKE